MSCSLKFIFFYELLLKEENINRVNDGIPTMSQHLGGSEYKLLRQRLFRLFRDRHWTFYLRDFFTVGSWPAPALVVLQRMWKSGVDWSQLDMFLFVFCWWGGKGRVKGEFGGGSDYW